MNSSEYISQRITNFDKLNVQLHDPIQVMSGGFLLCLDGTCDIVIDIKHYHIKRGDLVVTFPYSIIQVIESSDNFDSIIIGAGIDFFAQIEIPNKSQYFTTIKENPSISLNNEEAASIIAMRDMLLREQRDVEHPYRNNIDDAILKIILYKIAAIYSRRTPNTAHQSSRDEVIFNSFIFQLFKDYHKERSLEYYAQIQLITPSHLSRVVKRVSSRNASDWINSCVINNIKHRLHNKSTPIATIADEFNFPNDSFFSQYFKKGCGMTPRQYRASLDTTKKIDQYNQ